jgi:hypothetical protein
MTNAVNAAVKNKNAVVIQTHADATRGWPAQRRDACHALTTANTQGGMAAPGSSSAIVLGVAEDAIHNNTKYTRK